MAEIIAALAALVAAVGGIVAALLAYRAHGKATEAVNELVIVKGQIHEVGAAVDGRLAELLRMAQALSHAEGVALGEQSQRDRAAEATS
jgi:hypothetical protein